MDSETHLHSNRDYLLKQSDMLQGIINRMAGNSLTIKQLTLTIWTGVVGFGFTSNEPSLFLLVLIPTAILACLDASYLYYERRFRENFNILSTVLWKQELPTDRPECDRLHDGNFIRLRDMDKPEIYDRYIGALVSLPNLVYLGLTGGSVILWLNR